MRDGWSETALGSVLKLSNKKLGPHKEEPEIFAISKYDGVVLAQDYFDRRIASKSLDGYKVIGPGDWVYSTIHIDEGSIAVNHFPFRGVVSPMYTSMIWNSHLHDYRFFEFLLKSDGALIRYQENAQGTVNRRRSLSWKAFSEMTFVVPPLDEQKRIVDVLSSVDAYINALQQQADTARTARNAVLHELLSAGGDDWTKTTLGDVLAIQSGFAFSTNDWAVEGYPVIKINNVRDGKVSTESCSFIADPIPQGAEKFLLNTGDLLITLTGEIGATGIVDQTFPMYLNQRVGRVSIHKESKVLLQYLVVLFNYSPVRAEMWSLGKGNAQLNISPKSIHEIEVNLPPLPEQRRIVGIVSSMDDVIQATEQAVLDAKNFRSGLLSDLLSGEHEIPASYDSLLGAA